MASLLTATRFLGVFLSLSWMACGSEPGSPPSGSESPAVAPPSLPTQGRVSSFRLDRTNQGPFLERTVERFEAVSLRADVTNVLWSASGGALETQGARATWTLPRAGTASLTLTARTASGEPLSETYQFRVSAQAAGQAEGGQTSVPLAPVAVDTSGDVTGLLCDLAFDPAGTGHLIYYNSTHPSIWYGTWNGSAWTTQQVDGMGFNTGGVVREQGMSLAVDAEGRPHIVYAMEGKGIWYATRSGSTWIRERVSPVTRPPDSTSRLLLALDPSQNSRPTIVYVSRYVEAGREYFQPFVASRTGTNDWTAVPVFFPNSSGYSPSGESLFDPSGALYVPLVGYPYGVALGRWKSGEPTAVFSPNLNLSWGEPSLARTSEGHLLMANRGLLLDITPASPWSSSTFTQSLLSDPSNSSSSRDLTDVIFAAGKPHLIQYQNTSLELLSPDASNYWTYTNLGSAFPSKRVSLAYRPTTGTLHSCFQYGSKVMFQ